MDELERYIQKLTNERNRRITPEFEGYSPEDMHNIIYYTFGEGSPLALLEMSESDYNKVPILNQVKYLLQVINKSSELPLTKMGFLKVKTVKDIYSKGFIVDEDVEIGLTKIYKEESVASITLTRIIVVMSGLVKKRYNKLSLTKKGESLLNNNAGLLSLIFETFGRKFNWAYFDGYDSGIAGQMGYGFTLILLSKYGGRKRLDKFYSDKYYNAFPKLLDDFDNSFGIRLGDSSLSCYSFRTFDRFLNYFGLIEICTKEKYFSPKYIIKTKLFDKMIMAVPHNNAIELFLN